MGKVHLRLNRKRWHWCRLFVLKRDRRTCQSCGRIGGRLEVHHIHPLAKLDPENPNAPYETEGLQTLCRPCHFQTTLLEQGRGPSAQGLAEIGKWAALRKSLISSE